MEDVIYRQTESIADLQGILDLQLENHKSVVDEKTKLSDGFVTVRHTLDQLQTMQSIEASVIAVDADKVVAYIIAMTKTSRNLIPVLQPMFDLFDGLTFLGQPLHAYNYMVVGQVCVSKDYRGKSVFKKAYDFYRSSFNNRYDFCITEIDVNNHRSMQAHKNIGFETIHTYKDRNGIDWAIVAWNWAKIGSI